MIISEINFTVQNKKRWRILKKKEKKGNWGSLMRLGRH